MNMPGPETTNPILPGAAIVARITEALDRQGTHTWDDLQDLLVRGDAQIWWNDHGAWVTELMVSPRLRWLNVWIVAGQIPEVMELQEQVEDFARTKGCAHIVAAARPGWEVLIEKPCWEKYGWKKHGVVLRHAVEGV